MGSEMCMRGSRPNRVVALSSAPNTSLVPLLRDRMTIDNAAAAFLCEGFAC